MRFFKCLTVMLAIAAPTMSAAYVLDSTTKIVTDVASGKQWLQWTETSSLSVNSALGTYQSEGWRLASNAEIEKLFSDFFAPVTVPDDQSVPLSYVGEYGDGLDPVIEVGQLFGWTEYDQSVSATSGDLILFSEYSTSIVKFGSASDGETPFNELRINSEFFFNRGDEFVGRPERANLTFNRYSGIENGNGRIGVALVREISAFDVPEPSSLVLLGLGLWGLGYARRKANVALVSSN